MAKIRLREIESHLQAVQQIMDDFREEVAAEKAAAATDGAGSGLGAKTLEETDHTGGGSGPVGDDPAEFPGSPKRPAITNSNMLVGAKDEAPAGIRNPSNGRTHVVQVFDTPRMPSKVLKARQPSTADAWLNGMQDKFAADSKAASDKLFE